MAPDCGCNTTGTAFIETQEFFVTYCITFVFFVLCVVPFRVQIVDILHKLHCFDIFISIFMKILCIGNIILGLYQAAHECGHSQVPEPKLHKSKCEQDQQPLQSVLPPKDKYLVETQTRQTLVIELMVRNMSDSHIFLKKGVPVAHVILTSLVPLTELLPEMEATLGTEAKPEPLSVMVRQEKLLEKLSLDRLAHWSPRNAAVVRVSFGLP